MNALKFTPREYAIYNQVWSLSIKERQQLDSCFILHTDGDTFYRKKIYNELAVGWYMRYKGVEYKVLMNEIPSLQDKHILLSLRYSAANCYAVALVKRLTKPLSQHALSTFSELE